MPTRNQSGKPEHVHQNLNRKRKKSGKRYEKAIKWYRKLLKRQEIEGATKWIVNTLAKAEARRVKLGLTMEQITG
jgi:hypothetical protein